MTRYFLLNLYNNLKTIIKRAKRYPVIYNANAADESSYSKRALLVYVVKPFLPEASRRAFPSHQNVRQCKQIAGLLGELGYIVDVADVRDRRFKPSRDYGLVISNKATLTGNADDFRADAIRIYLSTITGHRVHNANLRRRHDLLFARRQLRVMIRRRYAEVMPYVTKADAIVGFGNELIMSSWKEVFEGPIYAFNNYGYKETRFSVGSKDFARARRNFLFFAGGSQILKGLDLLLEIFPRHPDLHLYVCSPFKNETDFCSCYHKELYETPNVHPIGWIRVNSDKFYELVQRCAYVIHPSCSDASPGSVVQCMYSGLVPLVTNEAGIDTEDFGLTFIDDSLEEIEKVVVEVSQLPEDWHRTHSIRTRKTAEEKYSEDAFMRRWSTILEELLSRSRLPY